MGCGDFSAPARLPRKYGINIAPLVMGRPSPLIDLLLARVLCLVVVILVAFLQAAGEHHREMVRIAGKEVVTELI